VSQSAADTGEESAGDDGLSVLIVDDEKEVADAYALRLRDFCTVQTAYDGEEALSIVESEPVDIILLDRHMPGLSGDDVLEELDDRGFYGRVLMVTAIDPGIDVFDLPFDDYLCKPVDREDLHAAIEQQRTILAYETLGEYCSVESKRSVVASELSKDKRDQHDEYTDIQARAETLKARARRLLEAPDEQFAAFEAIGRESM
jgi:DNA-binding response OmpR family regulator